VSVLITNVESRGSYCFFIPQNKTKAARMSAAGQIEEHILIVPFSPVLPLANTKVHCCVTYNEIRSFKKLRNRHKWKPPIVSGLTDKINSGELCAVV
jgi:hypothetical protein